MIVKIEIVTVVEVDDVAQAEAAADRLAGVLINNPPELENGELVSVYIESGEVATDAEIAERGWSE